MHDTRHGEPVAISYQSYRIINITVIHRSYLRNTGKTTQTYVVYYDYHT